MTAPVIFYMFLNAFAPFVISDNFITTLVFDEPIVRVHSGASGSDLYLEKSSDSKMLFIKAKGRKVETNLNVPTKSGKLYSFLIRTGDRPHSIIRIKDGKVSKSFKDIKNLRGVIIQEAEYVARVVNNSKVDILVNSRKLVPKSKLELPKGSPIYINKKRVYR